MSTADANPLRTLSAPLRFAIAVLAVTLVFVVGHSGSRVVDDGSRFLLLGMAVMASAWFAGTGPALLATVAGALLGAYDSRTMAGIADETHLALFVVQGLLLTAVVAELRRARRVAEQKAHDAQVARLEGEAANRMKDEFLATISHELRTPLNAVLGWVHLLRTGKLDSTTASRGLESIERNVRLQAQLTGDLLDVSKALTGRLCIESRATSLAQAVRQAATAVVPAAHARGVRIETKIPDTPVVVLGDAERLRQIVWHLIANAIKFTPRAGRISVSVDVIGDEAQIVVADSGPGIDPGFLPRIFERFTQEDASPTRPVGGLGIGLALVRELVELHGGEISAQNRQEGTGAVFTARFPLQPAGSLDRGSISLASVSVPSAPLDDLRVLVLDRDADARDLMRTVLELRGAEVRTVDTVAEALEALEAWRPDVLVSDSSSPERDSYALVGKVLSLESERGGRIPAVALTSVARSDARVRDLLAATVRNLPKPIEPAVLAAEVARLSGRERRRAKR